MTIKRRGNLFKLTPHELRLAYEEQQRIYDKNDCSDFIDSLECEDVKSEYGVTKTKLMKHIDEIVYEHRRNIDKYDMGWSDAVHDAVRTVAMRLIEEEI